MPALGTTLPLQEKASKVGFDWDNKEDIWNKVIEEIEEMQEEVKNQKSKVKNEVNEELENEIGDVFFALVNYSRVLKINPENALKKTNTKFIKRFNYIEKRLKENGKKINESNLKEMDTYWNESKKVL